MNETQQPGQHDPDPARIPGHEDGVGIGASSDANTHEPEDDREAAQSASRDVDRERDETGENDDGPNALDD